MKRITAWFSSIPLAKVTWSPWILRISCKINVKPKGFTLTLQETRSIHDSKNWIHFLTIFRNYAYTGSTGCANKPGRRHVITMNGLYCRTHLARTPGTFVRFEMSARAVNSFLVKTSSSREIEDFPLTLKESTDDINKIIMANGWELRGRRA